MYQLLLVHRALDVVALDIQGVAQRSDVLRWVGAESRGLLSVAEKRQVIAHCWGSILFYQIKFGDALLELRSS